MFSNLNSAKKIRVAISQSNYVPWWGYFYLISKVDYFIFYDCVQFTKNDWRNRNLIISGDRPSWISIPVGANANRRVNSVLLPSGNWRRKHLVAIENTYSRNKHFEEIYSIYKSKVLDLNIFTLSQLNQELIIQISQELLNIKTQFLCASNNIKELDPTDKLIYINQKLNSSEYISAPAGRQYIKSEKFLAAHLELNYINYPTDLVKEFGVRHQDCEYNLSILDTYSRFGNFLSLI